MSTDEIKERASQETNMKLKMAVIVVVARPPGHRQRK